MGHPAESGKGEWLMSQDNLSGGASVAEERITLFATAEEWPRKQGKKAAARSGAGSRATDRSVGSARAPALTRKRLGEVAEAEFVAKAVGLGFAVAKPWGDSEPYDFIVNARRNFNFWRVQVKSAHVLGEDGTCSFRAHDHAQNSYSPEDIDALVAYAKPEGVWYVFPVRVVMGLKGLKLYPGSARQRSKYERWREAWEVLRRAVRRARR